MFGSSRVPRDPVAVVVRVLIYLFLGLLGAFVLGQPKRSITWPPYDATQAVDR